MAENTSTTPEKSAGDVRKSQPRAAAEGAVEGAREGWREAGKDGGQHKSRARRGSKYTASQDQTWHSPAIAADKADTSGVHELTGKSLEYNSGPGRENFVEGHYATDSVNQLDHLAHTMEPRNQFD